MFNFLKVKKRLFIHIPKCAGVTVRGSEILKRNLVVASKKKLISKEYTSGLIKKMKSIGDHHGIEHARWRDIHPKYTEKYRAFAIVRNPWSRVVSRYFFCKKVIEVENKAPKYYADVSSFEAFLEERYKWGGENFMWHRAIRGWYPSFDHVADIDDNIKCDILRFENLNEEIINYFNLKNFTRARNVTGIYDQKRYMDLYNEKSIQIVADWYKKDIDTWGFDFDTGAKKNYFFI